VVLNEEDIELTYKPGSFNQCSNFQGNATYTQCLQMTPNNGSYRGDEWLSLAK